MLKATDVGYSHSKGMDTKGNRVIIQSVWGEVQVSEFGVNGTEYRQIKTDEGAWFLGESALEQSRYKTTKQDRSWIKLPAYRALHLYLLTQMTDATNPTINLATGLPIRHFSDRKILETRLIGEHSIKTSPDRTAQRIRIENVLCILQGLAAIFSEALDTNGKVQNNEAALGLVGLIDIGGYTVNISTSNELRPITIQTTSVPEGVWNVAKEVEQRINAAYPGQNLHGHETMEVMRQGHIKHKGRKQDVNGIIFDVVHPFIEQISGEASRVWGEAARLDVIFVAGGGADIIGPAFCKEHPQAKIVSNPQWANVEGYLRFGRSQGL